MISFPTGLAWWQDMLLVVGMFLFPAGGLSAFGIRRGWIFRKHAAVAAQTSDAADDKVDPHMTAELTNYADRLIDVVTKQNTELSRRLDEQDSRIDALTADKIRSGMEIAQLKRRVANLTSYVQTLWSDWATLRLRDTPPPLPMDDHTI